MEHARVAAKVQQSSEEKLSLLVSTTDTTSKRILCLKSARWIGAAISLVVIIISCELIIWEVEGLSDNNLYNRDDHGRETARCRQELLQTFLSSLLDRLLLFHHVHHLETMDVSTIKC